MPGRVGKNVKTERASDLTKSTASAIQAEMRNKQEAARLQLCTRMLARNVAHTRRSFDKDRRDVIGFMRSMRQSSGTSGEGRKLSGTRDRDWTETDYARHSMSRKRMTQWRQAEAKIQQLLGPDWMRAEPEVDGVDHSEEKLRVVMGMMGFSDDDAEQVVAFVEREAHAQQQPQLDRRAIYLRNRKCKHLLDMNLKHFRSREDVFAKLRRPEMEPPKPKSAFPAKHKPDPMKIAHFPFEKWQTALFDEYARSVTSLSDSLTSPDGFQGKVRRIQSAGALSRSNETDPERENMIEAEKQSRDVLQLPVALNISDVRRKATSMTSLRSNASSSRAPVDDVNVNNSNVRLRRAPAKMTSQSRAQSQPIIRITDVSTPRDDDVSELQEESNTITTKRLSFETRKNSEQFNSRVASPAHSTSAMTQLRRRSEMLSTGSFRAHNDVTSETGRITQSNNTAEQMLKRRASLPASAFKQTMTSHTSISGEDLMPRWKRQLMRETPEVALQTENFHPRSTIMSRAKRRKALDALTSSNERDVSKICAAERERRASKVDALMAVVKIRELMTSRPMNGQQPRA